MAEEKAPHCFVPCVAIGVNRDTATLTSTALHTRNRDNYPLVACLDYVNTPAPYNFSPQNLGAVLYALNPRPKGLITGTAVTDEALEEIEKVWEEYVENVIKKEGLGGHCWVQLSKWHPTTGPPPDGWDKEIVRQLDAVFL